MVAMGETGETLGVLVLAAGKGTRMKSETPKVMQPVLEEPMLSHVLRALEPVGPMAAVVGYGGNEVSEYLVSRWPKVEILWQKEQLGTGHAVMAAKDWLNRFDKVLVVNGDMPLLTEAVAKGLIESHRGGCSFVTMDLEDPRGYGRVVRLPHVSIVEQADCSEYQLDIKEVNAGVYLMDVKPLLDCLKSLKAENSQKEYYLVDVIRLFYEIGLASVPIKWPDSDTLLGVNDPIDLAKVSGILKDRYLSHWMKKGLKCLDPSTVWIGPDVTFDGEAFIYPNVQIWGKSHIGNGVSIGSFTELRNAALEENSSVAGYGFIQDSRIKKGAKAGPFCYIRENSVIGEKGFAGKFVEIKKSSVGRESKVPHLSYIGDAAIGDGVNIGAGTITCNYDGISKHPTVIGDGAFIGSDTMLVAPVTLGDDSMTAAGSVITSDVPEGALAVGRARQRNIEGWAEMRNRRKGGDHDQRS